VAAVLLRLDHELREDRGVHRLGEDRVGGQEEHPRRLVGHDGTGLAAAQHDGAAEEDPGPRVQDHAPAGVAEHLTHLVVQLPSGSEAEPGRPARPEEDGHVGHHPPGAGHHEEPALARAQVEAGIVADRRPEHEQGRHHHDGVADRRSHGDREAALGLQHAGGDGAGGVEDDLGDEEAQQEGDQLALLVGHVVRHAEGECMGQPGRGQHAGHADGTHAKDGDAQDPTGDVLGVPVAAALQQGDEGGDQDGRQGAGGQELEQHVRQRVGRLEGVAQVAGAQHRRQHEHPPEADRPGDRGHGPHPGRGPGCASAHVASAGGGRSRLAPGPTP
jgi:hypothetical protein